MKIMEVMAETEGNSCSHRVIDAPHGGIWPLFRSTVMSYGEHFAEAEALAVEAFAKKAEDKLIMFGFFEANGFTARYGKSAFGTPYVSLEFDPDDSDIFMRWNITYIVLPKEFDENSSSANARSAGLTYRAEIPQNGNISLQVWSSGADYFRAVRLNPEGFEIELMRSSGQREFQSFPEDGDKVRNNAVAMLDGILEQADDDLLISITKRLKTKINRR